MALWRKQQREDTQGCFRTQTRTLDIHPSLFPQALAREVNKSGCQGTIHGRYSWQIWPQPKKAIKSHFWWIIFARGDPQSFLLHWLEIHTPYDHEFLAQVGNRYDWGKIWRNHSEKRLKFSIWLNHQGSTISKNQPKWSLRNVRKRGERQKSWK